MRSSEDRHWWYVALHELTIAIIRDRIDDSPDAAVLDAGCGTGGFLSKCRESVREITGFEFSPHAFSALTERGLSPLVVRADLLRSPYGDGCFGLVASHDVLCDFDGGDLDQAISELVRLVRPGGYLVLNLPAYRWMHSDHDRFVGNLTRFTATQVSRELKHRKMSLEYCGYRVVFLFPIVVIVRLLKKWSKRTSEAARSDVRMPSATSNRLLTAISRFENGLIRRRWRFPFGLSVYVIARKPEIGRSID